MKIPVMNTAIPSSNSSHQFLTARPVLSIFLMNRSFIGCCFLRDVDARLSLQVAGTGRRECPAVIHPDKLQALCHGNGPDARWTFRQGK